MYVLILVCQSVNPFSFCHHQLTVILVELFHTRSTPCAYIKTVFYISLFSCLCRWVIRPDAVYFVHSCVHDFLRIKLFQVHITDMKMNLSCCFEGRRFVCFIVYNTSKNIDIHSNIYDMGNTVSD
ncbi:hypothetical protein ABCA12_2392 [Acinetobacter junii]|nr:hypothetical protein ABCA12_2392 [Acinetobacter junii]